MFCYPFRGAVVPALPILWVFTVGLALTWLSLDAIHGLAAALRLLAVFAFVMAAAAFFVYPVGIELSEKTVTLHYLFGFQSELKRSDIIWTTQAGDRVIVGKKIRGRFLLFVDRFSFIVPLLDEGEGLLRWVRRHGEDGSSKA